MNLDLVSRETSPYFSNELSTIYALLHKKVKTSTSFALKRKANTHSEVMKVRFFTKMHFLLDITPLLTIFVAIVLTIFSVFRAGV